MWIFRRQQHPSAELLSEFLDGRLTSVQEQRVSRHMESCQACREELESLRSTVSLLQSLPDIPPPRSFTMSVPPPVVVYARPSIPFRAPSWAYVGAASIAGLAMAVMVSADITGYLEPSYQRVPGKSGESVESVRTTQAPEVAKALPPADSQAELATAAQAEPDQSARMAQGAASAATAEPAMSPLPQSDDTAPGIAALGAAEPESGNGVEPSSAAEATGPSGAAMSEESAALSAEAPSADSQLLRQENTTSALPEGEAGSTVLLTTPTDVGTPTIWRVLEAALAALAVLFAAGLLIKLHLSKKSRSN